MYLTQKNGKKVVFANKQQTQILLTKYMYLEANGIASILNAKCNTGLIMVWFSIIPVGLGFFFPVYVENFFAF